MPEREPRAKEPATGVDPAPHGAENGGRNVLDPRRLLPGAILAFLGLALFLACAAYLLWRQQEAAVVERTQADLAAVVEAKAREVRDWQEERISDARTLLRQPFTRHTIIQLLAGETVPRGAHTNLIATLSAMVIRPRYEAVRVLAPDGSVVAEAGQPQARDRPEAFRRALETGLPQFDDFLLPESGERPIRFGLFVPVRDDGGETVGVLALRIDPYLYFYPMLAAWPTASPSAALLLVREENAQVIFLNRTQASGLPLAVPSDTPGLVGAHAALARQGHFSGIDYRGEPVLAAARNVRLSPWALVAKIDQEEVFEPLRTLARHITGVSVLLLMGAGVATASWWRKQQAEFRAFRYRSALRQEALTRHFDYLAKYANDIIVLTDAGGRIVEANDRAVEVYGYGRSELLERGWDDLCGERTTPLNEPAEAAAEVGASRVYEAEHRRADGSLIPVEVSARAIRTDHTVHYQAIIRDITERREAEARIRRLSNLYAALSQTNQAIVRVREQDRLLEAVCRIAVDYGGFRAAWVGMVEEEHIRTLAWYGENAEYFAGERLRLDAAGPGTHGLPVRAVQEDSQQVSNDLSVAPLMMNRQEAQRMGFRSAAAFPLRRGGRPAGVLAVYAAERGFFDAQLLQLLDEMALDVSFALDSFELEVQRRRAEESLRQSEFRFRQLFDNMNAGVAVYRYRQESDDFIILDVNRALERIEQVSREALIGRPLLEHFPGAGRMGLVTALCEVVQTGEAVHLPPRHYEDGRITGWRENWIYCLPSGEVVAVYDDVTVRMEAEQALRMSEERLRLALEGSQDGFWDVDFQAGKTYYSHRFAEMFGYTPGELEPGLHGWEGLIEPDDLPRVEAELQAHLRGETPHYRSEHRMRTKSGERLWVLARGTVARRDGEGHPLRMAGTHTDITDRKRAEERLRLWAKVLDSSGEGIYVTDAERRIILVNRAFSRLTGYSPDEALGRTPGFLSSGRHDRDFYDQMWRAIREEGYWQGEIFDRRKSGEVFPEWLAISAVFDEQGTLVNYVALFSDISERKEAEARIEFLSRHDMLTGLPNRRLLHERLQQAIANAERTGGRLAVLTVDVDHFKTVNDSLGHGVGDQLLRELGERLGVCVGAEDIVVRGGGDEFIIVLVQIADPTNAARVAACINAVMAEPFHFEENEVRITVSIGIGVYPEDGREVDLLIRNSDTALYHAKARGRNTLQFFIPELNVRARERLRLESDLRSALDRQELILYYQPQISAVTEQLVGVEALLRWQRREHLMLPADFVPVAEESGLIVGIGNWVLREACRQQRAWAEEGVVTPMAVNVSAIQFQRPDFPDLLARVMAETGVDPACIEVELTEGALMRDVETAVRTLVRLKEMGVALAIDDFGTGYSSLNYLRRFPIDRLKVDQSFVRDMEVDAADRTITEAIIGLGKSLGLRVIAEGVETQGELTLLRARDCEDVQGFLFAEPMPPHELIIWYREFERLRGSRSH